MVALDGGQRFAVFGGNRGDGTSLQDVFTLEIAMRSPATGEHCKDIGDGEPAHDAEVRSRKSTR